MGWSSPCPEIALDDTRIVKFDIDPSGIIFLSHGRSVNQRETVTYLGFHFTSVCGMPFQRATVCMGA
jgi:hypothetical protein